MIIPDGEANLINLLILRLYEPEVVEAEADNEVYVILPYQVACLGSPLSEIYGYVERIVQTVNRNRGSNGKSYLVYALPVQAHIGLVIMETCSVGHPLITVPDVVTVRYKFYSNPHRLRSLSLVANSRGVFETGL